ncbi:MAG: leucyl/phenylalanyl-tRNA--protein transferase, partial [Hyphomicrobiaceae bacterium]|nr:leucyl/phenylalanyl-tRNA--protein transferase [Hyphomicrobiaceae bacterium]
ETPGAPERYTDATQFHRLDDGRRLGFQSGGARCATPRVGCAGRGPADGLGALGSGVRLGGVQAQRISALPQLAMMLARHYATPAALRGLPDPDQVAPGKEGLCGILADTRVATILAGMRQGLYPMGHVAPMKWWSPVQRCVVFPTELRIEKNLARRIRNGGYRITFDADPLGVLAGCAAVRERRWALTWITPDMMRAALAMFDAGHMHSVEVWNAEGQLVGGLYGYAVGPVFSIESQFHIERDTSNIATVALLGHLSAWGFAAADGKAMTSHLKGFGFRDIPRATYRALLDGPAAGPAGRWRIDDALDIGSWNPAKGPPSRRPAARAA